MSPDGANAAIRGKSSKPEIARKVILKFGQREFYVWVNPADPFVQNNIGLIGSLSQPPPSVEAALPENLMFVFNPDHKQGFVSRFHVGALKNYMIEYQLELERNRSPDFRHLPSRFHSLFLFESVDDAERYREGHGSHVGTRILKRGVISDPFAYSKHDSAWIDFLRLDHYFSPEEFSKLCQAYWSGKSVEQYELQSCGKPWTARSIFEVLFYGRLDFPNKGLGTSDHLS